MALRETAQSVENRIRRDFSSSFRLISDAQQPVEAWLNAFGELLPERQLVVLRGHYRNVRISVSEQPAADRGGLAPGRVPPGNSFEFLKRCRHPDALGFLFLLWKDALTEVPSEALRDDLEEHFKLDAARVCPPLRFELANADARIRVRAAKLLGRLGTLDDIGLLSDLLALPPQEDEAVGEREALAAAIEALSKRK